MVMLIHLPPACIAGQSRIHMRAQLNDAETEVLHFPYIKRYGHDVRMRANLDPSCSRSDTWTITGSERPILTETQSSDAEEAWSAL